MDVARTYVPLPAVVQPQVPPPIELPVVAVAAKEEAVADRMIIVHTKSIEPEEMALFQFHGKCLVWDDRWLNIPLEKLPYWDYLFVDMRIKSSRIMLGAIDPSKYDIICYVPWWHKDEKFIDQLSSIALTKFPLRAISKEDFNRQLLSEKLQTPSILRTLLGYFVPCFQGSQP